MKNKESYCTICKAVNPVEYIIDNDMFDDNKAHECCTVCGYPTFNDEE